MKALGIFACAFVLVLFLVFSFEDRSVEPEEDLGCPAVFKIPDTLDRSLLLATYRERMPKTAYSLIAYKDLFRHEAVAIRFFCDQSVITELLVQVADNTFRSLKDSGIYVIKKGLVEHIAAMPVNHNVQIIESTGQQEYLRTDQQH